MHTLYRIYRHIKWHIETSRAIRRAMKGEW